MQRHESRESFAHDFVVFDQEQPCPYLPHRLARTPFRWQMRGISAAEFDTQLAAGDRRAGKYLYRAQCNGCAACQAIRIPVAEFEPTAGQRRVWRRGQREILTNIGAPHIDEVRIALFNEHARDHGLARDSEIDEPGYRAFLVETCCSTLEFSYHRGNRLIGPAVADRGVDSLSAVYCYYASDANRLSPGTYSILRQLEYCRREGLRYLYLGYYVVGCRAMTYKRNFHPHERLIEGVWRRFERNEDSDESANLDI